MFIEYVVIGVYESVGVLVGVRKSVVQIFWYRRFSGRMCSGGSMPAGACYSSAWTLGATTPRTATAFSEAERRRRDAVNDMVLRSKMVVHMDI